MLNVDEFAKAVGKEISRIYLLINAGALQPEQSIWEGDARGSPYFLRSKMETYIKRFVMPNDPGGDAVHLALASYHACDVLLTWNCQHLANFKKLDHIRRVNVLLDLPVPALLTPLELLGESELL